MNSLHDARAWDILRRIVQKSHLPGGYNTAGKPVDRLADCQIHPDLIAEARALLSEASELEEAKRMIAHLQEIRRGLIGALKLCSDRLAEYPDAIGGVALECARKSLEAAQAGKIPPQVQTVKILGETPIEREAL